MFKRAFSIYRLYPGWLMVAVGFILLLLMFGTRLSFGLYIKPIAESFGTSRAFISGSQSLYMVVYAVFALIAGNLTDKYGPKIVLAAGAMIMGVGMLLASQITSVWQYYLSYGVLVAIGSGAMYVPVSGAVSKFFTRKRNFALGIATSGSGFGQFLIPPFMEKVVQAEGWQTAFLYTALLLLVVGVSLPFLLIKGRGLPEQTVVLYEPPQDGQKVVSSSPEHSEENQQEKHYTLFQAMSTIPFWMYFGMYFVICFVIDGVIFVHMYPYLTDIGFEGQTAAKALGYLGLISTVSMIAFAPLGDRISKRYLLTIFLAIHTFILFWLINIGSEAALWLLILFYGIWLGAAWPLTLSILSDTFGSRNVSSILGACTLAFGIAGLTAPWLAGLVFDLYRSYVPVFYLTIFLSLLGAVFAFFIRRTKGVV